jgi:hypothetical protein
MKTLTSFILLALVAISCTTNPSIEQDTPVVSVDTTFLDTNKLIETTRTDSIGGYTIVVSEWKYAYNDSILRYDSMLIEKFNNVIPDDTLYHYVRYKGIGKVLINK